jgi:hypothetical protein
MKKISTKSIPTSKGSSSALGTKKHKPTPKISKTTPSGKKIRKIVAPKSASNIKAKSKGDLGAAVAGRFKSGKKAGETSSKDVGRGISPRSPKLSGIDKKKISITEVVQKAKATSARKSTKSPRKGVKLSKSPRKIVGRKNKDESGEKQRERSRKDKSAKKVSRSPKAVSKAKARMKDITQEDHSEDDYVMSVVKKGAKKLEKIKKDKVKKATSESDEESHNITPVVRPKGIKIKQEAKIESPSSSEVEIPLGKSTEKKKPIKQQFKGIDPKGISEEITKIIKRIEEKKKKGVVVTEKKPKRETARREKVKKEITRTGKASERKYKLQFNPNLKVPHVCEIFEVAKSPIIRQSDIILAILEFGTNPDYYQLPYSPNSAMFWDDVLEYEEAKAIFQEYKGETLRKYWIILNKTEDGLKIGELIKKHKSHMDTYPSKIKCIISTIQKYFKGEITQFDVQISTLHAIKNPLKVSVDPISGDTFPTTRKFEDRINKRFPGRNYQDDPTDVLT